MGNTKSRPPASFYGKTVAIMGRLKTVEALDALIEMLRNELEGSQSVCIAPKTDIVLLVALAKDKRALMLVPPNYNNDAALHML